LLLIHVTVPPGTPESDIANQVHVQGGGAPAVSVTSHNRISVDPVPPGFEEFGSTLVGEDGTLDQRAGSHPFEYTTSFAVNTKIAVPGSEGAFEPAGGDLRNIDVTLPPGLIGNPTATTLCSAQDFNSIHVVHVDRGSFHGSFEANACPDSTVVGLAVLQQIEGEGGVTPVPIYSLVPPKGMPAQFGFQVFGAPFFIDTKVRTGGDYGVTAFLTNLSEAKRVTATSVTLWGIPAAASHDPLRGACLNQLEGLPFSLGSCPAGLDPEPFFRLPTSCDGPLTTQMKFETWTVPSLSATENSTSPRQVGCDGLHFEPGLTAQPEVQVADSPTGLNVDLHLPQSETFGLTQADLRDATVTLPRGVTVNPASAGGLAGCTQRQIDLEGAGPASCPDASKVGSVTVDTPLLDHPIEGGVFVATQNDNPFHSLLAIYIAASDPQSGVVLKLAGHVEPDPVTGQLTTTFEDNPQLPFEDLSVSFFGGPRAALRTPATCGTYTTTSSLKPWSAPASPDVTPSDSFAIATVPGGGACAPTESAQPHHPSFSAGTLAPVAGEPSPFLLRLRREDGSQTLRALNVTLPKGLLANLSGIPYCSEAQLGDASRKSGAAEQANPSCPAASRVGTVRVAAGAGSSPVVVSGIAYLAGPYKDAPLSLAIVTPALAGPFDLGTVVVRAALRIDPETTQVTVVSDPIPTILQGIPLDVRSVAVDTDRPNFTLNPTDCEPSAITGEAFSLAGRVAPVADRFQVGGCRGLDFSPTLSLTLNGKTKRTGHPAVKAVLRAPPGQANIASAVVTLPPGEQIDNAHVRQPCTRPKFDANECPPSTVLGFARATSPLLDKPLEGPVYFRANGGTHPLPDIVADLRGQIHVVLVGHIDSVRARVRTTFDTVPDAPVTNFTLSLAGGKKGLLVNNRDICARVYRAIVKMTGQNGKTHDFQPRVRASCGKKR
jgi:hypothetical protein